MREPRTPSERLTVNLIPRAAEALASAATRTGLSKTDVVNRAVQMYDHLEGLHGDGAQVLVRQPSGDEQVMLWF
jgi:hypothetical protein